MRIGIGILALFVLATLGSERAHAQLHYEIAFPNLTFTQPTALEHAPDGNDWLYVVEQPGRIRVFENDKDVANSAIFLNIQARVNDAGWEEGLLGLAFHPNYAQNGYFFVHYTASNPRRTVISRFERDADNPLLADPDSEVVFLTIPQPFANHNGGDVTFGPDGYLYIAVGDGGSGGDPQDHGQNTTTLLGTVLRIDVDANPDYAAPDCGAENAPYTIPDNQLADGPGGACDEIFAWGLRNPWRFSFDPETDWFWVADVGQNAREEVNLVLNGDNLGWRVMEGSLCYASSNYGPDCGHVSLKLPVWEYGFTGAQSITGGFVYRGNRAPEIAGRYVYADYMTGHIWALEYDGQSAPVNTQLWNTNLAISSFGVDMHHHLYFTHLTGGRIYHFRSDSVNNEDGGTEPVFALDLAGPNPFRSATTLRFEAPAGAEVEIAVFDLLGRRVDLLHSGPSSGSPAVATLSAGGLAAGAYIVRMMADGHLRATQRVTVVR